MKCVEPGMPEPDQLLQKFLETKTILQKQLNQNPLLCSSQCTINTSLVEKLLVFNCFGVVVAIFSVRFKVFIAHLLTRIQ